MVQPARNLTCSVPPFLNNKPPLTVNAKNFIFMQSDESVFMYYLQSGVAKLTFINQDGNEKILRFVKPGNIFGECGLFLTKPYGLNAVAITDCEVYHFDLMTVQDLLSADPEFVQLVTKSLSWKLWSLGRQLSDFSFENLFGKVVNTLVLIAKESGERAQDGSYHIKITHQDLANFIGSSRASVTSTLNQLEDQGVIEKKFKKVIIPDLQLLLDALEPVT